MEVVCGRCKADYEFDDALISARGTTVRCTNCGLQFKVFPAGGVGAPEEWSVLSDEGAVICTYATLADLQRAIGFGEVTGDDLLVRGDEAPRRMAEILELAPLLRQGASYRPPAVSERPPAARPAPGLGQTRIGFPTAAEVHALDASPPPGPPALNQRPRRNLEGPKIRSALSGPFLGTRVAPESGPGTLPSGSPGAPSSRSHLPSLSATLVSPPGGLERPEPSPLRAEPVPASEKSPQPRVTPDSEAPKSSGGLGSTQPSVIPEAVRTPRTSRPVPGFHDSEPRSSAIRSERQRSGEPRRMARGALFVMTIFGGALLFALTFGRQEVARLLSARAAPGDSASQATPEVARPGGRAAGDGKPLSGDALRARVEELDVEWLRQRLEPAASASPASEAIVTRAILLLTQVGPGGPDPDSKLARIHLFRMAAKVPEARQVVAELGPQANEYPYALAMLDLAEESSGLSPLVLSTELAQARSGRSPFLPESARILVLTRAGELDRARAELSALRQIAGEQVIPLEGDLSRAIERQAALGSGAPPAEGLGAPPAGAPAEGSAAAHLANDEAAVAPIASPSIADPKAANENPAPAAAENKTSRTVRVTSKEVPVEVQAWASEADALWNGGDEQSAVVLYMKVKRALGSQHYLGQRAQARIRQANREGANP
jgi:predicted Zn finger-like uncharacterized protein